MGGAGTLVRGSGTFFWGFLSSHSEVYSVYPEKTVVIAFKVCPTKRVVKHVGPTWNSFISCPGHSAIGPTILSPPPHLHRRRHRSPQPLVCNHLLLSWQEASGRPPPFTAGLDLAHATLFSSTSLDPARAALCRSQLPRASLFSDASLNPRTRHSPAHSPSQPSPRSRHSDSSPLLWPAKSGGWRCCGRITRANRSTLDARVKATVAANHRHLWLRRRRSIREETHVPE